MSHNIDTQKNDYRIVYTLILINSACSIIHYWKPDFYWNSPRTTAFKHLVGEQAADILGYVNIIGGFAILLSRLLTKIWSKKDQIE